MNIFTRCSLIIELDKGLAVLSNEPISRKVSCILYPDHVLVCHFSLLGSLLGSGLRLLLDSDDRLLWSVVTCQ